MSNNLSVRITADITSLQVELTKARAEVNNTTAELNKLGRAFYAGTLDAGGQARMQQVAQAMLLAKQRAAELAEQLNKSGASFAHFGSQTSQLGGIGGALEAMQSKVATALKFTGVGVAIAGLEKLAQAFSAVGERAAEMRSTADVLGVTVEQFQAMSAAADAAGVSSETLARFAERLVGLFQQARDGSGEAAEKLKLLGITNQQIASSTFGVNDALAALHARLTDATTAQSTQNQVLAEFGPRGANAIEVLKAYSGSAADVAARMRELNGLNAEQAASAADTYAAYKAWGTWLENSMTKALDATAEGISRVAEVMLSTPAKMPALQATVEVPSIAPQVQKDAAAAQAALQTVEVTARQVTKADLDALQQTVSAQVEGTAERLAAMRQYASAAREFYPTDQADKLLEIERQLTTETKAYGQAQMRASAEATQKSLEASSLQKRAIDEQLADSQKYLTEQREIAQIDAQSSIAVARMKLQAAIEGLDAELAAHKITAAQKLAIATQLNQQLAALDKEEVQTELALEAPRTAAYERTAKKIEEIEARLNLTLAALQKQFVQESAKNAEEQSKQWSKAVGEIENAEGSLTSDLLSRRKSLSQSLLQIGQQLVQQEIANDAKAMTSEMLLQNQKQALEQGGYVFHLAMEMKSWLATQTGQATQTTAVVAGNTARQTADASAAAVGREQQAAVQGSSIMADAAKAFSGTYASVASIPYVGWIMAPAAAAAAFATVAGYEAMASLAEGAWEIPQTGLYHLHQGEAVAPVPYARGMREAAGGSAAGTGRGSATTGQSAGGGDTHHHWQVSATDASSFAKMIDNPEYRRAITRAAAEHVRHLGYR